MVETGCRPTASRPDPEHVTEIFTKYRKTHNDGVFDAYTARDPGVPPRRHHHRPARRLRPRPHHRRLPPGGAVRRRRAGRSQAADKARLDAQHSSTEDVIRDREELAEQIRALRELVEMARRYGHDISRPAADRARGRAVALLRLPGCGEGAERRRDVLGRTSTFLDIYLQRDLDEGRMTESRGAGARRRLRDQAAHRPLPAHPEYDAAVLRRPDLGDRGHRRHGQDGRPW
jgi:formate C-acetyltransferase